MGKGEERKRAAGVETSSVESQGEEGKAGVRIDGFASLKVKVKVKGKADGGGRRRWWS